MVSSIMILFFNLSQLRNNFKLHSAVFMSGRVSDPALKAYNALIFDTVVGKTIGLMAKFTTNGCL